MSAAAFEAFFREELSTRQYSEVLVFGYTGETVSDYLQFNQRHLEQVTFRVLNRDWVQEARDESEHNRKIAELRMRPWQKAAIIKFHAEEPWLFKAKRNVRYYTEHPFVKAILLVGPATAKAFISFYHWQEIPDDGGSEFKGAALSMIFVPGDTPQERDVIQYLRTQFEYCWKNGQTAEQVVEMDRTGDGGSEKRRERRAGRSTRS